MDLHFVIDQNSLTKLLTGEDIETIEMFQEGERVSTYRIKKLAAKFMVSEDGQPVPYKQAVKVYNQMSAEEYSDGLMQFLQAMSETAIPKASGTPLNSPSVATSPVQAASPAGSSLSKQPGNGEKPPGKSQESDNPSPPGEDTSGNSAETSTQES